MTSRALDIEGPVSQSCSFVVRSWIFHISFATPCMSMTCHCHSVTAEGLILSNFLSLNSILEEERRI